MASVCVLKDDWPFLSQPPILRPGSLGGSRGVRTRTLERNPPCAGQADTSETGAGHSRAALRSPVPCAAGTCPAHTPAGRRRGHTLPPVLGRASSSRSFRLSAGGPSLGLLRGRDFQGACSAPLPERRWAAAGDRTSSARARPNNSGERKRTRMAV